jgi:type IV pilus biogenesis protein CpaD/CtpE
MKLIVASIVLLAIAGCASQPLDTPMAIKEEPIKEEAAKTEVILEKKMQPLTREEVVSAIQECESARTKPVLISVPIKINGYTRKTIVDVYCVPQYVQLRRSKDD